MVKIISDSSTMYSSKEGEELGIKILPLSVIIDQKMYHELDELNSEQFVQKIQEGFMPSTSQPPIGMKEEAYRSSTEEVLDLTMADGLSGTYHSALMAKDMVENNEHIHVLNTKTLCGPHRYIVNKALEFAKKGHTVKEIIEHIQPSIDNGSSFLIPRDFQYLKRGGRLSPVAATLGGLVKIVPILEISKDGTSLEKFGIKKTFKKAMLDIIETMKERHVDENYEIFVSHALNPEWRDIALRLLKEHFHDRIHLYTLSPAFITQGGPGCIAIQYCKK